MVSYLFSSPYLVNPENGVFSDNEPSEFIIHPDFKLLVFPTAFRIPGNLISIFIRCPNESSFPSVNSPFAYLSAGLFFIQVN